MSKDYSSGVSPRMIFKIVALIVLFTGFGVLMTVFYFTRGTTSTEGDSENTVFPWGVKEVERTTTATDSAKKGKRNFSSINSVSAQVGNGTVDFTADDSLEPGDVEISWNIEVKKTLGISLGDAPEVEINFVERNGALEIEEKRPNNLSGFTIEVDMDIRAHPDCQVDSSLGNGTLKLNSPLIAGASLGNGTLDIDGSLCNSADLSLGNGQIYADLLITKGNHSLSLGNGEIKLNLKEGSSTKFDASTGIGKITTKGIDAKHETHFLGDSATGSFGNGGGMVDLSIGNGSITISSM